MPRFSDDRKEAVLNRLLPPYNMTVSALAKMEGISEATLYNWRKQARLRGRAVPGPKPNNTDQWSAEAKLATVIETASLSEAQLNEYCREKGLFVEQVKSWKEASLAGFQTSDDQDRALKQQSKADKLQIKKLEKELRRKEKALAETAALLVLRKKLDALWENSDADE
jgi:transposase-like protein